MTERTVTDHGGDLVEQATAVFNEARTHRYLLTRRWGGGAAMTFIMLNPSTADAFLPDPTLTRCKAFARRGGCGAVRLLNLFALRSTEPKALYDHADPVGGHNDAFLLGQVAVNEARGPVVAAWGVHGVLRGRDVAVARLLAGVDLVCLGVTRDGHPRHPLYVRGDAPLVPFHPRTPTAA